MQARIRAVRPPSSLPSDRDFFRTDREQPKPQTETLLPVDRTSWNGTPIENRFLLRISAGEFESLRPLLAYESFPQHATLQEQEEDLESIHFLNRGLVSVLVATKNGKTVEVGTVGNEGVVGTPAILGMAKSPNRAVVQVAGNGFRVRIAGLQNVLSANPELLGSLNRYGAIQGMSATQLAACNRLHGVEQRLSRWLLVMRDRTNQISLSITHESLASVLGTDRPSVSLAAGGLQRKGAIEYRRGAVMIVNHELLEQSSCECYAVLRHTNKLMDVT